MPVFGSRSNAAIDTVDPRLQKVLREAIKYIDFSALEGYRDEARQNAAFNKGLSKVRWPHGKHNKRPALAVDVAPFPIDWTDTERFVYLAGWIMAIGRLQGVRLRWGADWNRNNLIRDEKFLDWGHFEIDEP